LVNRKELLGQASATLSKGGIIHAVYNASTSTLPQAKVVIASVDTLTRRKQLPAGDFLIIDECHIATFDPVVKQVKDAGVRVMGFTATPWRLNYKYPLSDVYEVLYQGPTVLELIEQGFLVDAKTWSCKVDLSGLQIKAGEYTTESQNTVFTAKATMESIKRGLDDHSQGSNLVFCPSVASSMELCEYLNQNGYKALHIDGSMTDTERKHVDLQLRSGAINTIVNCSVLTFGYDNPIINTVVVNRATTSLALWHQMCGRGSRLYDNKRYFHILDFGGNIDRHQHWQTPRDWQVHFAEFRGKKANQDVIPIMRECPQCWYQYPVGLAACPECGEVAPLVAPKKPVDKVLEYVPFDGQAYNSINFKTASIDDLEAYRTAKGYKIGWVVHQLAGRGEMIEQYFNSKRISQKVRELYKVA
jgi:superfamily II DNA or RNA helicase